MVALTLGVFVAACGDVGDDATPHPLLPFAGSSADAGADASVMTDAGGDASLDGAVSGDDAATDGATPGEAVADGAVDDDAEDALSVAADARQEAPEGALAEAGVADATTAQDAAPEAAADAATLDAPVVDAAYDARSDGGPDGATGGPDATVDAAVDATTPSDAGGSLDSTVADAGGADASTGHDAGGTGQDGGGSLVPCTRAGQQGCVQCGGNSTGLCTPSEALIVEYDIRKGFVTAPGPDGNVTALDNSCYACLVDSGYINDDLNNDTGHECGDLAGTYTAGNGYTGPAVDICLATLACILETDCSTGAGDALACYCGPGGGSPTPCKSAGAATNGACKTPIVNGLPAQPDDGLAVQNDFTEMYPSGTADNIFVQALGVCNQCLQ